ncbi:hypothetical protein [Mesorhizobium sp. M0578]|uniref:hypothetical protein n=1 Tax=unclassified Mesorhizobium TaxID=325217 RepID=UPI00333696E8
MDQWVRVNRTGFKQQDTEATIFGQTVTNDTAGRPRPNNAEVELDVIRSTHVPF